jgi:hypothetical protein
VDNLIYSLNGTVPIFAVMVIGYLLKKYRMLDEDFVAAANRFVFRVGRLTEKRRSRTNQKAFLLSSLHDNSSQCEI